MRNLTSCSSDRNTDYDMVYFFSLLDIISKVLLHAPSMPSVYAKLSRLSTHCLKERGKVAHMQGSVFTIARLEISLNKTPAYFT